MSRPFALTYHISQCAKEKKTNLYCRVCTVILESQSCYLHLETCLYLKAMDDVILVFGEKQEKKTGYESKSENKKNMHILVCYPYSLSLLLLD